MDLDEIVVAGRARLGADVAVDLIAARVLHGLRLGQLASVFALADGGMVVRDLFDVAMLDAVEAGIADVSNGDLVVLDDGGGKYAGHALALGPALSCFEDRIVGQRDGFAEPLLHSPRLPFQADPNHLDCDSGGLLA